MSTSQPYNPDQTRRGRDNRRSLLPVPPVLVNGEPHDGPVTYIIPVGAMRARVQIVGRAIDPENNQPVNDFVTDVMALTGALRYAARVHERASDNILAIVDGPGEDAKVITLA